MPCEFSAWVNGFQKYFQLVINKWNQENIIVELYDQNSLPRVSRLIGMDNIV